MRPEEAWQSVLGEIEINMGRSSYLTWLKSARLMTYEDGQFVIGVANGYAKEWIEQRKLADIKKMLGERMSRGVDVRLMVATGASAYLAPDQTRRPDEATAPSAPAPTPVTAYTNGSANGHSNVNRNANGAVPVDGLLPKYTFEAFVVGSGNRMAHAAAMAVAEMPAERYNPLFLYGGSGLGKTHLLHAIGNAVQQRGMKCRYVTSETFTNELIGCNSFAVAGRLSATSIAT